MLLRIFLYPRSFSLYMLMLHSFPYLLQMVEYSTMLSFNSFLMLPVMIAWNCCTLLHISSSLVGLFSSYSSVEYYPACYCCTLFLRICSCLVGQFSAGYCCTLLLISSCLVIKLNGILIIK